MNSVFQKTKHINRYYALGVLKIKQCKSNNVQCRLCSFWNVWIHMWVLRFWNLRKTLKKPYFTVFLYLCPECMMLVKNRCSLALHDFSSFIWALPLAVFFFPTEPLRVLYLFSKYCNQNKPVFWICIMQASIWTNWKRSKTVQHWVQSD